MSGIYIKNGRVILKDGIINDASVEIAGSKILSVGGHSPRNGESMIIDAGGCFVSPGFIDSHIHGECEKIFFNEARHGTTAFVIAESCAPLDRIYKKAGEIKKFIRMSPLGANVLGVRLEGPYISKEKAGAQDAACIRKPDVKELYSIICRLSPLLKMMTIAPELKGAGPLVKLLCKHKIIASIGHSNASYESAIEGIDAGIAHSTHTFNAMSSLDRRDPGAVGAVLMDDRVTAEVIPDLIHVHRAMIGLLVKMKEKDKVIMVTDSVAAEIASLTSFARNDEVGIPSLRHSLNDEKTNYDTASMTGGAYRFEDGRLAGSSLTMIGALKNAVKSCNIALRDAVNMITLNPAKLFGVEGSKGSIAAGKDADIVIFDKKFDVKTTIIRGRIAYTKGNICAG